MNQINVATGGRPFNYDDLLVLQTELTDAVQAQYASFGNFILSGCVVSGPASAATVSAGIVCLDGQLLRFPGQSGVALPAQLQAGGLIYTDPRPYQTGGTKFCQKERQAILAAADATYGGAFIPLDTWGGKRWSDVQRASVRYLGELAPLATAAYVPTHYDATGRGKPGSPAWGWALANGQNGTEDLRGRRIAAYSDLDSDYAVGAAHGNNTVAITTANLPLNPPGTRDVATYTGSGGGNLSPSGQNGWEGRPPQSGAGVAVDVRAPYLALPYRQWVGYGF